jgi:radical SAM superfamily enzyme YgiQ (UPF0313 family)
MTGNKKNIYLVDLGTGTDRSLIPLGCGLIISYAKTIDEINKNFNFEILMMENNIEEIVDQLNEPYAVGLACYVWNFLGCQQLAKLIKIRFPKTKIIFGGPSIPQDKLRIKEFLLENNSVDILVHMEGEKTFSDLLLHYKNNRDLISCDGISFRTKNDEYLTTKKRERIQDLDEIPSPYLTGIFDTLYEKYKKFIVGILWETNRGCPFSCSFCDWGNASVNKVTRYSIHRVVEEIKWAAERKIHYVYCTDANYGIKFDRDFQITKDIVEIIKKYKYPNTFVLNWTKNQHKSVINIAEKFQEAGVSTNTTISVQSFHEPTITAIKRGNIKLEEYMRLKTEYHLKNLSTYTELILGLPKETVQTFLDGLDKTMSHNMYDQFMIYTANILENTELCKNKKLYGIKTAKCAVGLNRRKFKYERFGEDEIVIETNSMSKNEWHRLYQISFLLLSLYNLRIAFFPIVLLNQNNSLKITKIVEYIYDEVSKNQKKYPIFFKVVEHLNKQANKIIKGISSVSETEDSEGIVFTPHEASTFIFSSYLDQTYNELNEILETFIKKNKIHIEKLVLKESIIFQKMMIPRFVPGEIKIKFKTNIAYVLYKLTTENKKITINPYIENDVIIKNPNHNFKNQSEFNRRRVSSGYSIGLAQVTFSQIINDNKNAEKNIFKISKSGPTFAGNFISSENN